MERSSRYKTGRAINGLELSDVLLLLWNDVMCDKNDSVLLNLYRDNHDSDDENIFCSEPNIASVSLGATRNVELRQNPSCPEETREFTQHITIPLIHGSLITMAKACQLDCIDSRNNTTIDRNESV